MKIFIYTDNDTDVSFEDVFLSTSYKDIKHFKKENPDLKPLLSYNVKDVLGFDIEKLQAELREKDLEIEEMKDRLKYEVKMIEGAANDEIHLLNHNIERLINMNKTMREALEFYAVSGKYHYGEYRKNGEWSFNPPIISNDSGETARETLEKVKQKDEIK